jgi:hypothetical protein
MNHQVAQVKGGKNYRVTLRPHIYPIICFLDGELVNQNKHLMEDPLVRDVVSIKNRWTKQIQKNCLIFMTFYNRAHKNCVSGATDDDVLDAAMEEHREQLGTPFKFKHCLAELEKIPKFNPKSDVVEEEEVVEILDDDDDDDEDVVEVDSNPSNQKKTSATKVKKEINNTLSLQWVQI